MKIKNVAILTSGGDAPGMNSAIFGAFTECQKNNIKLFGVQNGYDGLIDNLFIEINYQLLAGRINRGGTMLKSGRSKRFLKSNYFKTALSNLKNNKIDALIIVGGDGSLKGAMKLRDNGVNVVCLPGTIDNDLNFTYTIGFDTATNNIVNAIDNITDSLYAFNYGAVIKIMGNQCADLVNAVADAIHSDLIIKNPDYDLNSLVKSIKSINDGNHLPPIVLVLENSANIEDLSKILQEKCKIQIRPHILGYIQRGGTPSAFDRRYGFTAGSTAVKAILNKQYGFAIGLDGNQLVSKEIENCFKF